MAVRGFQDELDEEDVVRAPRKSNFYPFSIGGAVVGFLIGIAIVVSKARVAKEIPEIERTAVREQTAKDLQSRKEGFAAERLTQTKKIQGYLSRLRDMPPDRRKDFLFEALRDTNAYPTAFSLARYLLDGGAPPGSTGPGSVGPRDSSDASDGTGAGDDGFKKILAEAQKLKAEGKIGDAREKIREAESEHTATHGAEIDKFVEDCDREITTRWERDTLEIDRLAREGEVDKAVEVGRAALVYGDGLVRKEAEAKIRSIESQAEIQRTPSKATTEETEDTQASEKSETPGVSESDIESELEKEIEGGESKGADASGSGGAGPGPSDPPAEDPDVRDSDGEL